MRTFTVAERRARLGRRHLLAEPDSTLAIPDIVGAFVGLHATDPAVPYLSLWSRLPGFTVADLDRLMYQDRALVKQLAMRRTLWLVPSPRWAAVRAAASQRVAANERRKLIADVEKSGITDDGARWLETAAAAVRRHLADVPHASAAEIRSALPELAGTYDPAPGKRWGGATPIAPRVLTVLAADGHIVRGPNDGGWTTARPRWAHAGSWLAQDESEAGPDSARAELVGDWLRTFGPATVEDIKWWFGDTATAIKAALRDVSAVEVDLNGTPGYVLPDDLDPEPDVEPWVALLPGLDVTTMGWSGRDWYLGGHRARVFDSNGNAGPTVWCDGRVVGGWRQDAGGRIELQLLEDPGRAARKLLDRKAANLTAWLDGTRVAARFPSPLSKS